MCLSHFLQPLLQTKKLVHILYAVHSRWVPPTQACTYLCRYKPKIGKGTPMIHASRLPPESLSFLIPQVLVKCGCGSSACSLHPAGWWQSYHGAQDCGSGSPDIVFLWRIGDFVAWILVWMAQRHLDPWIIPLDQQTAPATNQ